MRRGGPLATTPTEWESSNRRCSGIAARPPEVVIWLGSTPNSLGLSGRGGNGSDALVEGSGAGKVAHNNSLERTQPQRGFMYDVDTLRRSARGR